MDQKPLRSPPALYLNTLPGSMASLRVGTRDVRLRTSKLCIGPPQLLARPAARNKANDHTANDQSGEAEAEHPTRTADLGKASITVSGREPPAKENPARGGS